MICKKKYPSRVFGPDQNIRHLASNAFGGNSASLVPTKSDASLVTDIPMTENT